MSSLPGGVRSVSIGVEQSIAFGVMGYLPGIAGVSETGETDVREIDPAPLSGTLRGVLAAKFCLSSSIRPSEGGGTDGAALWAARAAASQALTRAEIRKEVGKKRD